MDAILNTHVAVFLLGVFAAAFVAAVAGFAFGMVAAAIWMHALLPVQVTVLIVAYALIVQGYAVWKLRRSIDLRRLAPFILGGAVGIPAGTLVLDWASPPDLRFAVGVLLVTFSCYSLARPQLALKGAGSVADGSVGVLNGVLGASTGLGGTPLALWCGMRGWKKDEQRAVFQPAAVATFLMTIVWLGAAGALDAEVGWLFTIGLPALVAGTLVGWKVYGRLDEDAFRKVVLCLLLASGAVLVATWRS